MVFKMKFKIVTLGCKVNMYESNVMRDALIEAGYEEAKDDCQDLDVVIVNTCTVTNTADQKSLKLVRKEVKQNPQAYFVVVGCSSQNNADKFSEIPGVDLVLGTTGKSSIAYYVNSKKTGIFIEPVTNRQFEKMRIDYFNQTRAYVKIQDGCNNFCSYCVIPYVRGNIRSKPVLEVLEEIKTLVQKGYKEVVLTGIHTGHYGADLKVTFSDLLKQILEIPNLERLRISSIEITELTDEFLDVLKNYPVLVDHLHIPLQSGCDTVLKRMNRKYDTAYFKAKVAKIREIRPLISLTTDVIVGFPGETDKEFAETIKTIKEINFSKIHVFPYSKRKGTKAALMDEQIPMDIKKKRVKELLSISECLEKSYFNKFVGREVLVLPEVFKDDYLVGHTGNYLPIKMKDTKATGQQILVHIDELDYPYLLAHPGD